MATNGVNSTTNSPNSLFGAERTSTPTGKTASEDMQARFLTLLMTQLKNQDPLNPTDANQMTAQLSQISTVSGIEKLNASMEKLLASYAGTQNMQAAAMIGKTVLIAGNSMSLGDKGAVGGVNLEGAADKVTITIKNADGKVVQTQDLGALPAGINSFIWDGKDSAGSAMPLGSYTFTVAASNGDQIVKGTALQAGMVNALTMAKEGVQLELSGNKSVSYSDIVQILG